MDMNRINRLYPQYQRSQDRRQHNIPVAVDRRSGSDRRSEDRVVLDKQLTRDIFEVKSKVAKIDSVSPRFFENTIIKQSPIFTQMNTLQKDVLVKEEKIDYAEIARRKAEIESKEANKFQITMLAAALVSSIVLSALSSAGAVIAIGTSLYIGARVLKTMIVKELQDKKTKDVE